MYFDVHTHHPGASDNIRQITNILEDFTQDVSGRCVSMGVHPRFIDNSTFSQVFRQLESAAGQKEVLAVGECGLDKLYEIPFALQTEVFQRQIELAETLRKPLIIHCVRSYNEVTQLLRNVTVPVIIHGVNNRLTAVQPFIDLGYYLSFGKALTVGNAAIMESFHAVPKEQLLLETDDLTTGIVSIYQLAASQLGISEVVLHQQIADNFNKIFTS